MTLGMMFWDVILGHYFGTKLLYFGMKIYHDNIVVYAEKENTVLIGPKHFFSQLASFIPKYRPG